MLETFFSLEVHMTLEKDQQAQSHKTRGNLPPATERADVGWTLMAQDHTGSTDVGECMVKLLSLLRVGF